MVPSNIVARGLIILIGQVILVNVKCVHVTTKLGTVKGISMLSRSGHKFNAFLGVPFAKPPIGELRFKNPVQITEPWSGIWDATKYPPKCIQPLQGKIEGSENCLYLNLYSPKFADNESSLPVWVFIYGGKKLFGDAAPYKYGPEYIMDKPVILVTMAYRMGAFGFLSTEDDVISGNFGLKDETAVLKWIQTHIRSFGGDPRNVTITGGSSGGIDVNLHLYSPLSKGLFHKAISQSGHSLNSEVVHPPGTARSLAWDLARVVGCSTSQMKTSEELLSCLQKIPSITLARASLKLMHDYILPFMIFGPVIESKYNEGAFLINDPCKDIEVSSGIPWILGSIPDEGSQRTLSNNSMIRLINDYCNKIIEDYSEMMKVEGEIKFLTLISDIAEVRNAIFKNSCALFSKPIIIKHFEENAEKLFAEYFRFTYHPKAIQVSKKVIAKYMANKHVNDSFYEISRIYAFSNFHLGTIEAARRYKGPLYLYCYDYTNDYAYLKTYLQLLSSSTKFKIGAVHGEELISLFNNPLMYPPVLTGNDRIVSDQIVDLWYNFVTCGDPNGNSAKVWHPVIPSKLNYLHIHNLTLTMKENYFIGDEYEFWKTIETPTLCNRISMVQS